MGIRKVDNGMHNYSGGDGGEMEECRSLRRKRRHNQRLVSQLLVHCQSGDDDLGIIYMQQHGDFYFHFGQNIFGTTFFYCRFNWGGFTKVVAVWKGKEYVDRLDCEIEGQCVWKVDERGFSWAVKGPLQTFTFYTGWVRA